MSLLIEQFPCRVQTIEVSFVRSLIRLRLALELFDEVKLAVIVFVQNRPIVEAETTSDLLLSRFLPKGTLRNAHQITSWLIGALHIAELIEPWLCLA